MPNCLIHKCEQTPVGGSHYCPVHERLFEIEQARDSVIRDFVRLEKLVGTEEAKKILSDLPF